MQIRQVSCTLKNVCYDDTRESHYTAEKSIVYDEIGKINVIKLYTT